MTDSTSNRNISIKKSAVGSAIISGDVNTIYVIHQSTQQRYEPQPTEGTSGVLHKNPYKGLAAFNESDADRYFGREAQVERLLRRFHDFYTQESLPRFLAILGPSGSGKSSLAQAGLIPELARRPLPGWNDSRFVLLVPGSRPLEALASVLARISTDDIMPVARTREFLVELKRRDNNGQYNGLLRIVDTLPEIATTPIIVLVDQFHELYTLCSDVDERMAFIENLLNACSYVGSRVSVVITLRTDFLAKTQAHSKLNLAISEYAFIVPEMNELELRAAISKPAKLAGYPLDEATIALLTSDVKGREGALPLLQFTLTRIWDALAEGCSPAET
ncbi:MAG: ATP-binding protein, partial [Cyanobacteria bacterium J06555_13]